MKIRLFFLLSAAFLLLGLLMPVGVYANDLVTADVVSTTATNASTNVELLCDSDERVVAAATVVVDGDEPVGDEDSTGPTDGCQDDGGFARVSWNS